MYDASNRKHIRAAEKAAKLADTQRGEIVSSLMSTTPGRQYVHDKLVSAHVFATSFSQDALITAFKEGERNQGLILLNDVMLHCPEQYILMMQESNARSSAAERSRESLSDRGDSGSEPSDSEPEAGIDSTDA